MKNLILTGLIAFIALPASANFSVKVVPVNTLPIAPVGRIGRPTLPGRMLPDYPNTPTLVRIGGVLPSAKISVPTIRRHRQTVAAAVVGLPDGNMIVPAVNIGEIINPIVIPAIQAGEDVSKAFGMNENKPQPTVARMNKVFDGAGKGGSRGSVDVREEAKRNHEFEGEDPFRPWLLSSDSRTHTLPEDDLLREIGVPWD